MHAKSALPCAWALGAVVALTGCATRSLAPHLSGAEAPAPAVVDSPLPPATRAPRLGAASDAPDPALPPSPPSVELLLGGRAPRAADGDSPGRAVPTGRKATVDLGLAAPAVPGAPCDVRRLFDEPEPPPPAEPAPDACPGGT